MIPCRQVLLASARAVLLLAGFGPGLDVTARADPVVCAEGGFSVAGADAAQAVAICATVDGLRRVLEGCGLPQARPLLVEVVAEVQHPVATCFATFDCHHDLIQVLDPSLYADLIAPAEPYARLPADVVLRALLSHELAHALAAQSAVRVLSPVDQEYIAAAMELDTMEPRWRRVYLDAVGPDAQPSAGLVDIWIYALAPRAFAANAWHHYALPGNGCDLIRRIVAGETSFARRPGER